MILIYDTFFVKFYDCGDWCCFFSNIEEMPDPENSVEDETETQFTTIKPPSHVTSRQPKRWF